MKATIELDFKPFTVPNFVVADNDMDSRAAGCEHQSFPLSALSPRTLDQMCEQFRKAVFEKAKKQQPPVEAVACPRCHGLQAVR